MTRWFDFLALALAVAAVPAHATVLTFDIGNNAALQLCSHELAGTGPLKTCAKGLLFSQAYGDQPGLDVRLNVLALGEYPNTRLSTTAEARDLVTGQLPWSNEVGVDNITVNVNRHSTVSADVHSANGLRISWRGCLGGIGCCRGRQAASAHGGLIQRNAAAGAWP